MDLQRARPPVSVVRFGAAIRTVSHVHCTAIDARAVLKWSKICHICRANENFAETRFNDFMRRHRPRTHMLIWSS